MGRSEIIYGAVLESPEALDTTPYLDAGLLRWTEEGVETAWKESKGRPEHRGKRLAGVRRFRITLDEG